MTDVVTEREPNKIVEGQLQVGDTLPWTVYTPQGSVLLSEGQIIKSEHQILQLLSRGAQYYETTEEQQRKHRLEATQEHKVEHQIKSELPVSFLIIHLFVQQIKAAFETLDSPKTPTRSFVSQILRIAVDIQGACDENTDAMLGSVLLLQDVPQRYSQALHDAILIEVCYRKLGRDPIERLPVIAAALTHDIGMRSVLDQLHKQSEPLTADQKRIIVQHPQAAVDFLKSKGVTDPRWLNTILQHHERIDGSGYPNKLSGDQICEGAKLLAIADNYTALVRPRAYRKRILHQEVLRELLVARGRAIDEELIRIFISCIGIYSPGTLVKLASGEIGIVTRLIEKSDEPEVALIVNQHGKHFEKPKRIIAVKPDLGIDSLLCPVEHKHLIKEPKTIWGMRHPSLNRSEFIY